MLKSNFTVGIKQLFTNGISPQIQMSLMLELSSLKALPRHPNIVQMLGIISEVISNEIFLTF